MDHGCQFPDTNTEQITSVKQRLKDLSTTLVSLADAGVISADAAIRATELAIKHGVETVEVTVHHYETRKPKATIIHYIQ